MKKVISLVTLFMAVLLAFPANAMAAESIDGDYIGKLTYVYMNGEKTPSDDEVITTVEDDGSSYSLYVSGLQIGNMPGKIDIDASNLAISTGSFSGTCTVTLTIGSNGSDFAGTINGSYDASTGKLVYTVDCDAKYLSIINFKTKVTFEGYRQ